ncbi:sigma-70 family RNA polymerase sigma factor [bacterium]|nr:sigma-70 family RNA polymerase sigma factor [bacterium]
MAKNIPTNEIYEKISEKLDRYQSSDDISEKNQIKRYIVTQMYPVVERIARTIARRTTDPIEDLIQAGFIGLLKAIEKYNPEKNDNFRVYAGYLIIGEMKHFLRDKLNMIRVPRHIQELSIRINNFTQNLTPEEVNSLTSDEMASALQVSPKAVDIAMQIERRRTTLSLEDAFQVGNDNLNYEEVLADGNYTEKSLYEDARIMFEDVINKLPVNERMLIKMYYKQDMSQKDIASYLNLNKMCVSRRLKQACDLLSDMIIEKKLSNNEEIF